MSSVLEGVTLDLGEVTVREVNARLQAAVDGERFELLHPDGRHSLGAGMTAAIDVEIAGHAGYYCAGMNQRATVHVAGTVAAGVAENMMSGRVVVDGNAAMAAGATAHGGMLVVGGNAATRCAISLKGADVVVRGSVGASAAFMAQSGRLVVCGDAAEGLGDSLYEARLFVRGSVAELGTDCIEKPMTDAHRDELGALLAAAGLGDADPAEFRRYGSARQLYNIKVDRIDA
ncbi:MAG: hypothetical protein JHC95_18670 [Solirubrobacteraceae bacterium]|nr:hypothetical protein [Solirubrobacteraceae bacterium]